MSVSKEESIRLHMDWWGKCRTCRHWNGADDANFIRWQPAKCENKDSDLYGQETHIGVHCPKWDSFDIDTALSLME